MTVLDAILEWSTDRPSWQRDALRRLVINGELSNDDINELTIICKASHGLEDPKPPEPLAKEHIPERAAGNPPVALTAIVHHHGVNALANNQRLNFGPNLTVVYGDNGAGKSGYTRILKHACRARGQEKILGNVISGVAPVTPSLNIQYLIKGEEKARDWTDGADDSISRVSVFDAQCAAVYLTEKTDVAFRPLGLDLFDKLVRACKAVRANLEEQQRAISASGLAELQAQISANTAVGRLLANITPLTKPEAVIAAGRLSNEEINRLEFVEKSLFDLQANDPIKLAHGLSSLAARAIRASNHLKQVEDTLSNVAVDATFATRLRGQQKGEEARRLREATFPKDLLSGTGTEEWSALWEAGRTFSHEHAYPDQKFPVVDDARCLFCQQALDQLTADRLLQFERFVASETERELKILRGSFLQSRKRFSDISISDPSITEFIKEIATEHASLASDLDNAIKTNEARRHTILQALFGNAEPPKDCHPLVISSALVETFTNKLHERVKALETANFAQERIRLEAEAVDLRARKLLGLSEKIVLGEIERKKNLAAYSLCLEDTRTKAITQKSTVITKAAVSDKLKKSFQSELTGLKFNHIEVELAEVGGADGVFYHKLVLTRAPSMDLPKVVSEGEQRCLSIASFFAELSTAEDASGIVFDDPVSSLDFQWRQGVARRLVKEAATRQVIVFTHDVVFLLLIKQFADELEVNALDQHVRYISTAGAGVCDEEMPWVAMPIKKKIGYLKTRSQSSARLFREGKQDSYEDEAKLIYGRLREAWERAIEEVLLSGVVERFRSSIQTQQIGDIADITDADCASVEAAMTRCSALLHGHDQAAAARAPIPDPDEIDADIARLRIG